MTDRALYHLLRHLQGLNLEEQKKLSFSLWILPLFLFLFIVYVLLLERRNF